MQDLISRGAEGHGQVHLLLTSAAELGFAWDGEEKGWVRASLPPLGMMTGPIQQYYSSILEDWQFRTSAQLAEREGFRSAEFVDFKGSSQLLNSSHLRERNKMLSRAILCGWCLERLPSWSGPGRKKFRVGFAVVKIEMGVCFGSAPFPHSPC